MSISTSRILGRLGHSVAGVSHTPVAQEEPAYDAPKLAPAAKNDMEEVLKNALSPSASFSKDLPR